MIARELEREIQWDCEQVILKFYACLDQHRHDELANLFTETGAWVRLGKELVGPQGILEGIRDREDWITAHVLTNLIVTVESPDRALSSQYVTLYRHEDWSSAQGPAPMVAPIAVLRHRDELVRTDGAGNPWRFQRKTSRAVMADRSRVTHYDKKD